MLYPQAYTCPLYVTLANQGRPSVFGNSNCGVASFSLALTLKLCVVSLSSIAWALNSCVVCVNTMIEIIQPKTSMTSCAIANPQAAVCDTPFVSYSFYHTTLRTVLTCVVQLDSAWITALLVAACSVHV